MRKANRWMMASICLCMLLLFVGISTHPQYFSILIPDNKIDEMTVDRSLEPITAEKSQLEMQQEQVIDESLAAQNAAWDECAAGQISFTEWQKRNAEAVFSMHPGLKDSSLSSNKVHVLVNGDRVGTENTARGEAYIDQGVIMLPLEQVNVYLGFKTEPSGTGVVISSSEPKFSLKLTIGEKQVVLNDKFRDFSVAPVKNEKVIYVPAVDYVECFGSYAWDEFYRTFNIFPCSQYETRYQIRWNSLGGLIRIEDEVEQSVSVSSGEMIENSGIADTVISSQKIIDGKTYLLITFNNGTAKEYSVLYRDDGSELKHLVNMMSGSSFWIKDNMIYYTRGLPKEGSPEINQLYMHPLDNPNQVVVFKQIFPVVASALTMRDNRIIAITPDGERHMVQF